MVGSNVKVDVLALRSSRGAIWGTVEGEDISTQLSLSLVRTQNKDSLHPFPLCSLCFVIEVIPRLTRHQSHLFSSVIQWVDEQQQQKGLTQNCPFDHWCNIKWRFHASVGSEWEPNFWCLTIIYIVGSKGSKVWKFILPMSQVARIYSTFPVAYCMIVDL